MKKITIAFDVDGTLIDNTKDFITLNPRIFLLLQTLSSFKNTKIVVWSGRWEEWAKEVVEFLHLKSCVDVYASKNYIWKDNEGNHVFEPPFTPDIAIDDIQDCELGKINLIVKEK